MAERAELLARGIETRGRGALRLHAYHKGKMQTMPGVRHSGPGGFFRLVHARVAAPARPFRSRPRSDLRLYEQGHI